MFFVDGSTRLNVGMAIGAGLYEVAGCVTAFVCVIMYGSRLIENHKRAKRREKTWDEVEKGI